MDAKIIPILFIIAISSASAVEVEHTMNDYIIYDDYIQSESQNIDVTLGSYTYSGTNWQGFQRKTNGRISAGGTATLVMGPYNSLTPTPHWTTIDVSGQGILAIEVAGAADNGQKENTPGPWSAWSTVQSGEIPGSIEGSQFLKTRITFTDYVEQLTIKYKTDMKDHPRLLIDDVDELRQRCQSDVAFQCQKLKEFADASSHYSESEWQWGTSARIYALQYIISGDSAYATKAYNQLLGDLNGYSSGWSMLAQGPMGDRFMITYDWIYNALTPSQRTTIETKLIEFEDMVQYNKYHHCEFNNHLHIEHSHALLAGIAMYGGENNEKAEEYLDIGYDYLFNHNVPAINRVSEGMGGWHESLGYFSYMANAPAISMDGMRTATEVNFFEFSQGLKNIPNWYLYSTIPYDKSVIHLADNGFLHWPEDTSSASSESKGLRSYLMAYGKNFNILSFTDAAEYAQYLIEDLIGELYQSGDQSLYRGGNVYDILWYDPDLPKKNIPDQRLTGYAPRVGEVVMREGNNPDDSLAMYHCGDFYGGHQQADNGHFSIWYKGYLAVDSGYYDGWGSSHHMNYARRTIAHNTLTIKKPGESFTNTNMNDGGQDLDGDTSYYDIVQPGTDNDACDMSLYTHPDFDYIDSDFTNSYKENKVSKVTRQFVYFRPDMFIVFDRVESTDASYEKKYLLHSQNDVVINGDTVSFSEGQGKLFSKTLLPLSHQISTVGGSGQEFTVEGTNFPMSSGAWSNAEPYSGKYRIEVTPASQNVFDNFLHVMQATDSGVNSMADSELLESGNSVGARIGDWVAMFSRTGEPLSTLQYSYDYSGLAKTLVVDLKPDFSYEIQDNQVVVDTITANDKGIIYFELPAGSHDVIIYEGQLQQCNGICKDQSCNDYDDCSFGSGYCASGVCCLGSCTAAAVSCDEADITVPFGEISMIEIAGFIDNWQHGSVNIIQLMDAIGKWKNGC